MARYQKAAATIAAAILGAAGGARAQVCDIWNPPPVTDSPDPLFRDTNGDGMDGMRCGPIFVCVAGNDGNPGTIEQPMRTINAAIIAAYQMTPKRDVYVSSNGAYNETIWFMSGVNVYGGYDHLNGWSRSAAKANTFGGVVGAWADNIYQPTRLDSLAIHAADNSAPGGHSIGLYVRNGGGRITLSNSEVYGGAGGAGRDGTPGTDGRRGDTGGNAGSGDCDNNGPGGFGGAGGFGANYGGDGGRGGGTGKNPHDGANGSPGKGPGGGAGGPGGKAGNPGKGGTYGQKGADGTAGANGGGATAWYQNGGDGGWGTDGSGGGGGGGGGAQICSLCNDGQGNGGSGGGGGGWRGSPGTGGAYGGSSVAVLVRGGTFQADYCYLKAGPGGKGGDGGRGGTGGFGGGGGAWYFTCNGEVGAGSTGGSGGRGGDGGNGGGGAGGNSIAVMQESGSAYQTGGTWAGGTPGEGGRVAGRISGAGGLTAAFNQPGVFMPLPAQFPMVSTHARMLVAANSGPIYRSPIFGAPNPPPSWSVTLLSQPAHGTAAVVSSGVTYQPAPGYQGWDGFTYRITDTTAGSMADGWMTVYVTVPAPSAADLPRILRVAGGVSPWSTDDGRLDLTKDGRLTVADAVLLARSVFLAQ